MTKRRMEEELEQIGGFLGEVGWDTELLYKNIELPTLMAALPLEEDYEELFIFNYIPASKEEAEFTKLLQIYARIPLKLEALPMESLRILMNRLNLLTTAGHFVLVPATEKEGVHMGMRYVLSIPMEELPDEGVVGEIVLHMTHYCQIMESLLLEMLEDGASLETVLKEIEKRL